MLRKSAMYRNDAAIAASAGVAVLSFTAVMADAPVAVTTTLGLALLGALGLVWAEVLLGSRIAGLERAALAAGLALAAPVIGGVALDLAGVPLYRAAWAGLLGCLILAGDAVLLSHGKPRAPHRPRWRERWRPRWLTAVPAWSAVAFGSAAVIAVGGLGLARAGAELQHYGGFTELWLVPRGASAVTAGLGVSNHQGAAARYRLVLLRNGQVSGTWNLSLPDGATWQRMIKLRGGHAIDARLYRLPDLARPYRHVSIDLGADGS
jgi:hypothetical protein